MPSKYDALRDHLAGTRVRELQLSFPQIERIIGRPLPRSAYVHVWWWSNEDPATTQHVQCRSWQTAGYDATPDLKARAVKFRKLHERR
jgi:hypothetical protein